MTQRWTPEQEAVFDAVTDSAGSINVQAVAGSGKTSTTVEAAYRYAGGKAGFVAFNKHIAAGLKSRLAGSAKALTLHGLGYAACKKAYPAAELDEKKPIKLLARARPDLTWSRKGNLVATPEGRAILDLARMAKLTLSTLLPDVIGLVTEYAIDLPRGLTPSDAANLALDLLIDEAANTATIDFDDQVWLPTRLGLGVEQFSLLLVDEAQDLNAAQRELVMRAAAGGRVVVVGDADQSIYSFTGADPASIPTMVRRLSAQGCAERPLTVTFRCPASHVELARRLVPRIQARPDAPAGDVAETTESEMLREVRPGDMVISRRNAPLVGLTLKLLAGGIKAHMVGRDLGRGLLDLISSLVGTRPVDIYGLIGLLGDYQSAEQDKLEKKDAPESQFQNLADRVSSLKELAAAHRTVQSLRDFVAGLGSDEKADRSQVVTMSSVHRAKGLEAERVWIADPESLPLVLSCRACKGRGCPKCGGSGTRMNATAIQQERNLLYVAVTRAKQSLFFVGSIPDLLL